jgi:hypothetical protein
VVVHRCGGLEDNKCPKILIISERGRWDQSKEDKQLKLKLVRGGSLGPR